MQRTMAKPAKTKADIHAEVARRAKAGEPHATVTSVRRAYGLTRAEFAALPSGKKAKATQARKPKAAPAQKRTGTKAHPFAGPKAHDLAHDKAKTTGRKAWYTVGGRLIEVLPPSKVA